MAQNNWFLLAVSRYMGMSVGRGSRIVVSRVDNVKLRVYPIPAITLINLFNKSLYLQSAQLSFQTLSPPLGSVGLKTGHRVCAA